MCGKLIYVIFAVLGLVVIDNFSAFIAVVICGLFIYIYFRILSKDFNKDHFIVSFVITGFSYIFLLWKHIILVLKNAFASKQLQKPHPFNWEHCGENVCLNREIDCIVDNISKHYLDSWYSKVGDNEEFILHLNFVIKSTLSNLCSEVTKVNRKRIAYTALQIYLHFFIHFIDAKKKSELKLGDFEMKHWATRDNLTQWCYLQSLVSSLIDNYGPTSRQNSLHSKHSPILHNFIVEILTEHILDPLSNILSDPSQLNSWLLKILESYIEIEGSCEDISKDSSDCVIHEEYSIGPKILLQTEDSFTDIEVESQSNVSECELIMSEKNDRSYSLSPSLYHFHKRNSESLSPIKPSSVKSSSNINLLDHDTRVSKSHDCSPISCDPSKIKRSKSADYICQMPQLRALNMRDYNIMKNEHNKMLLAAKSDLSSTGFVEQAEEAIEVPTLFSNVCISDTIQQSEAGPYTLYCIQYSGIFHDTGNSSDKPHFIKQEVNIKRRFREFVALQSRLEDNPSLKSCLKGIKGPSKWFAFPFSNMDKKNIAERKSFLENYLKELCCQVPIAQSSELQEFLAYGGDATVAFVKKAADISVPRFDKILVRGVKGAIDMFKTDVPSSSSSDSSSGVFSLDSSVSKTASEDSIHVHKFSEHLLEYSSREPELRGHLKYFFKNTSSIPQFGNLLKSTSSTDPPHRASLLRHLSRLKIGSVCQCSTSLDTKDDNFACEENCLGDSVIDILIESLPICQVDSFYSILNFLISPSINKCFVSLLEEFSEYHLALFLHILHEALWPTETNSTDSGAITSKYPSKLDKLKKCLQAFISTSHVTMSVSCIQNQFLEWIYLFLSTIQHQDLNRCLLFHLFDVVLETMCSKGN